MFRPRAVFVASFFALPRAAAAQEVTNLATGDTYSTISEAVEDAVDGDTLFIGAGTYVEQVLIDKVLTIVGEGQDLVTIEDHSLSGAVLNASEPVFVSDVTIESSTVLGFVGSDSTFERVTFEGPAGSISSYGALSLTDVWFRGTSADLGGAVETIGSGLSEFTRVTFQGTSATLGYGGAIVQFGGDIICSDCLFDYNDAAEEGGAIYTLGNSITLVGGSITNAISRTLNGGVIHAEYSDVWILGTEFSYNSSDAIWVGPSSTLAVDGALFLLDTSGGHAVRAEDASDVALSGLDIRGGAGLAAVYVDSVGNFSLDESVFCGLAEAAVWSYTTTGVIRNTSFVGQRGGAPTLYLGGAWDLENSIFLDNETYLQQAMVWSEAADLTVRHVVFSGNDAYAFKAYGGTAIVDHSLFDGILDVSEPWATVFPDTSTSLFDLDPMLIAYSADGDCTNDVLYPRWDSPLIDAGNPDPIYNDLDGSIADIGLSGGPYADPTLHLDADGDGFTLIKECDDGNEGVYPDALETCDGVDEDCDALVDEDAVDGTWWFPDLDGDSYGDAGGAVLACEAPPAHVAILGDCDDAVGDAYPDAVETCDGVDQDCDGVIDDTPVDGRLWYRDTDLDGYGVDGTGVLACGVPTAGFTQIGGDCEPDVNSVNPAGVEVCNGVDDNCSGDELDAPGAQLYWVDADGDGYGDDSVDPIVDCTQPVGYVAAPGDCDDSKGQFRPDATELAGDGLDQDCDGQELCFADADFDGYRDTTGASIVSTDLLCDAPGEASSVVPGGDCDDDDPARHPGVAEPPGDETDQDCDGGEICYLDADDDGVRPDSLSTVVSADPSCDGPGEALPADPIGDCDDSDGAVHPGAVEAAGDEVDGNCDYLELCFVDADADGWRVAGDATVLSNDLSCAGPGEASEATPVGDCNDADDGRHPASPEVYGDAIDQNCDGSEICFVDADDDGYRPDGPTGQVSADIGCDGPGEARDTDPVGDCDDGDPTVSPAAAEGVADGVDQDCDLGEVCYADADGDGHRPDDVATVQSADVSCSGPGEAKADAPPDDCDDGDAATHPEAPELPGDAVDQNCDGVEVCFTDSDDDGFRPNATATTPSDDLWCEDDGEARADEPIGDCDDDNVEAYPGAPEVAGDDVDQDCDGLDTEVPSDEPTDGTEDGPVVAGDTDEGGPAPSSGCGCSTPSTPGVAPTWLVTTLAALLVRRRRPLARRPA